MSKHSLDEDDLLGDEILADMQPPPKKKQRQGQRDTAQVVNNSSTWSCPTCTFANKHTNSQCEICDTSKPSRNDNDIVATVPLKNNSNDIDDDSNSNDKEKENKEEQDATTSNLCPKCSEEAIIIERFEWICQKDFKQAI